MSKRLVPYSFSWDDEANDDILPGKSEKLDLGSIIIPNILPTTRWDIESEWDVTDQWPPIRDLTPDSSSSSQSQTFLTPIEPQSSDRMDQGYLVGGGKKDLLEFKEGKCRRIFSGAVYCRTLLPTKKASDLSLTLESIKQLLMEDLRNLIEEHHGIKAWVGISNVYYSMKHDEEFQQAYDSTNHYMSNEWEIEPKLQTMMQYLYDRNSVIIKDTSQVQFQETESLTMKAVE